MPAGLVEDDDLQPDQVVEIVDLAYQFGTGETLPPALAGKVALLLFTQRSISSRICAELAVSDLCGKPILVDVDPVQAGLGDRALAAETARTLAGYCDLAMVRTGDHGALSAFADTFDRPLVNLGSDLVSPVRALADMVTLRQRLSRLAGRRLAVLGPAGPVTHSLLLTGAACGLRITVATPVGQEPDPEILRRAEQVTAATGGTVLLTHDPRVAVTGCEVVYATSWVKPEHSPGGPRQPTSRNEVLRAFRLDAGLLSLAATDALVMHATPTRRGAEVSAEILTSPHSLIVAQAHNRLPATQALLAAVARWHLA